MSPRVDPIVEEERQLDLYEIRVLGLSLWRLIRVPVIESIIAKRRGLGRSNHNRVDLRRIPHMVAGIARSLWHLLRLRRRRYLIIGFPRRRFENGEWIDPFSDPLIDSLGPQNVLCVEKPFGGEHCRPQRTRGIIHQDWLIAVSLFASAAFAFIPWLIFQREIRSLTHRVRRMAPVPAWRLGLLAGKAVVSFWIERGAASALLALVRPRAVLLTMRRHHHPLIHACKARAIPVYELQHGALAEGGFKYSTPYDPKLDPDVFLTFGEFWNAFDWGLPATAVKAVGFKYIADKKRCMQSSAPPDRKKVMLVSQPHVWRMLDAAFGAMVSAFPDVRFILKLHPQDVGRWWERYRSGRAPNVQVCGGMYPDLYSLFAECDCVCGYDSTVLFEASFLGLKVGILNSDGDNLCSALKFDGRFNFHEIRRPEQLGDLLRMETDPDTAGDNPFFVPFQHEKFLGLVQAGT
jgi:hypothetical protein